MSLFLSLCMCMCVVRLGLTLPPLCSHNNMFLNANDTNRVKVAWKNRDGYTFMKEELELISNTEGRMAIMFARKLIDK